VYPQSTQATTCGAVETTTQTTFNNNNTPAFKSRNPAAVWLQQHGKWEVCAVFGSQITTEKGPLHRGWVGYAARAARCTWCVVVRTISGVGCGDGVGRGGAGARGAYSLSIRDCSSCSNKSINLFIHFNVSWARFSAVTGGPERCISFCLALVSAL
jgi:hypothetical protein